MIASLYPELSNPVTEEMLKRLSSLSIEDAYQERKTRHETATYAATGGNRVRSEALKRLQHEVDRLACTYGYPDPRARQKTIFDTEAGKVLYMQMHMTPSEASRPGVWNFISCILLPDIVRWRFPGASDITPDERFRGNNRALRNTFGRLWWRVHTLYQEGSDQPFEFLEKLGEDELVQIMERTAIAASPCLAQQICRSFLLIKESSAGTCSPDLLRDAMKRLRRLFPFLSFDTLEKEVLSDLINRIFREASVLLSGHKHMARSEAMDKPEQRHTIDVRSEHQPLS